MCLDVAGPAPPLQWPQFLLVWHTESTPSSHRNTFYYGQWSTNWPWLWSISGYHDWQWPCRFPSALILLTTSLFTSAAWESRWSFDGQWLSSDRPVTDPSKRWCTSLVIWLLTLSLDISPSIMCLAKRAMTIIIMRLGQLFRKLSIISQDDGWFSFFCCEFEGRE